MNLAAIILAGGRSSRMGGGDKALADLNGKPVLRHVLDRLDVEPVAINANGPPARFAGFGRPVIADATTTFDGPLAGILAGLQWAKAQGCTRMLTVAADTPFFPENLAASLAKAGDEQTIAVSASLGQVHPTFAVWPVSLADDLSAQLDSGLRRVTQFIARHPSIAVDFPAIELNDEQIDPFFNINTPQDLAEASRIAPLLRA